MKKIWDWIVFILSLIYLGVAFSNKIEGFGIDDILTTDGLTLFAIIITFIGILSQNYGLFIPFIRWLILRFKTYDYKISIIINTGENRVVVGDIKKILESKLLTRSKLEDELPEIYHNRKNSLKYYYRAIHSQLSVGYDEILDEVLIELQGYVQYTELDNIIEAVEEIFLDNQLKKYGEMKRIGLVINLVRSKINLGFTNKITVHKESYLEDLLIKFKIQGQGELKILKDMIQIETTSISGFNKIYNQILVLLSKGILKGGEQ